MTLTAPCPGVQSGQGDRRRHARAGGQGRGGDRSLSGRGARVIPAKAGIDNHDAPVLRRGGYGSCFRGDDELARYMPELKVEHLEVRYGDLVGVADISLQVEAGQIVALLGSNGAGKTTTLSAIAGLIRSSPRPYRMARRDDFWRAGLCDREQGTGAVAGGLAALREADGRAEFARSAPRRSPTVRASMRCSRASMRSFRASPSGAGRRPARCRAASGRCWRSDAR